MRTVLSIAAAAVLAWWSPAAAATWVSPLPGRDLVVVRGFEPPATSWGAGHRGVDLLAAAGAAVAAAGPGRVTFAGTLAGRGVVTVTHGELRTTYEPVSPSVAVGSLVAAGDVIGVLQAVAGHCPGQVCLHWGLLRGEDYLDPMALLGSRRVRLLPVSREEAAAFVEAVAGPAMGPVDRPVPAARAGGPPDRPSRGPGTAVALGGLGALGAGGAAVALSRAGRRA